MLPTCMPPTFLPSFSSYHFPKKEGTGSAWEEDSLGWHERAGEGRAGQGERKGLLKNIMKR